MKSSEIDNVLFKRIKFRRVKGVLKSGIGLEHIQHGKIFLHNVEKFVFISFLLDT